MTNKQSNIPKNMIPKVKEITALIEPFCDEFLTNGYKEMSLKLIAALARKRPSPLLAGRSNSWAAGIIYSLGRVNFLFDKDSEPHMSATSLCDCIGVSQGTASEYSRKIFNIFNMMQFDPNWTVPEKLSENPLVWMLSVNGFMMDVRGTSHAIQDEAYSKGLIPYLPYMKILEDFMKNIEDINLEISHINVSLEPIEIPSLEDVFLDELPHNILDLCRNKPKLAIPILDKIPEKYKRNPRVLNLYASAYSSLGDEINLRRIALDNFKMNPDYLFAKLNLCDIYLVDGDVDKIPEVLGKDFDLQKLYPERSIFHSSECLSYYSVAAQYFMKNKDFGRAKTCYLIMYKISPDHSRTKFIEEVIVHEYKIFKGMKY